MVAFLFMIDYIHSMSIYQGWQTDKRGRRYPVYVCDKGHWHRGRLQAVKCNQKHRERKSI